ncbi:collagenase [Metabacillus herbersteinensis]|uniref:Collagenase n=1 Tax=Metabacillus herbersteinensis TaxID=283816 RepID=A0ABV6GJM9_9BACI
MRKNYKKVLTLVITFLLTFVLTLNLINYLYHHNNWVIKLIHSKDKHYSYNNIEVFFSSDNTSSALQIPKYYDEVRKDLTGILGEISASENENLKIIIFNNTNEIQKFSGDLESINGFYVSKSKQIGVISPASLSNDFESWYYVRTFRHEYTHHYLNLYKAKYSIDHIPKWFEEGLAEYTAVELYDNTSWSDPLDKVVSFNELNSREEWLNARKTTDTLYLQSYLAIKYLFDNFSNDVVKDIIILSKSIGFDKSFKKVTGISIEDLDQEILKQD